MPKLILINCLLFFQMISCCRELPRFVYHLICVQTKVKIDGYLDEPAWKQAQKIILRDNMTGEEITDAVLQTKVWLCYDKMNLYIAFECNDKDIWGTFSRRDEYLWKEEVVEIFIDTDNNPDTYVEIELSPGNVLFDSYIVNPKEIDFVTTSRFNLNHILTAVSIDGTFNNHVDNDRKWYAEIAIPFKDFPGVLSSTIKGSQWKINFYRVDQNKGEEAKKYAWSSTYGSLHVPSRFGMLLFE